MKMETDISLKPDHITSCRLCSSLVSTFWAPNWEYGGGGSSEGVIIAGWVDIADRGGGIVAPCCKWTKDK